MFNCLSTFLLVNVISSDENHSSQRLIFVEVEYGQNDFAGNDHISQNSNCQYAILILPSFNRIYLMNR